jgi:hypothetical protein
MHLVTIVAETAIEDRLVADVRRLGATGYTIAPAGGEGSRGLRTDDLGGQNVRLETLVTAEVADRILAHVAERYFPHHACVAWVSEVRVVRGEKYG